MKNRSVSLCLLTATLFASPVFAQGAPVEAVPPPSTPDQKSRPSRENLIKRFDQDADGQLNDAERQAAREQMRKKWAERGDRRGPGGPMHGKMRQHFDQDGTGQLDETERHEARKAAKKMRHRMEHRMMRRQWKQKMHHLQAFGGGDRPHAFRGQAGPGGGPRGPMRQAMLKRFDQDADGKLNEVERGEARKAGEAMRARAQAHRKEVLSRFDGDSDGKLGETERQAMRDAWQKFIEQQPPAKAGGG